MQPARQCETGIPSGGPRTLSSSGQELPQTIRMDVRMIAATDRDLKAAIAVGKFRSDLFYRLNVFPIHVPPLRERRSDIPLLVEHFLRAHGSKAGTQLRSVDEKTLEMLQTYSWPGSMLDAYCSPD